MYHSDGDWAKQTIEDAKAGCVEAQYDLGRAYYDGDWVKLNDAKSVYWLTKAAEQGHRDAQYRVGIMYSLGLGVKQNDEAAYRWFGSAAVLGHKEAQWECLNRLT